MKAKIVIGLWTCNAWHVIVVFEVGIQRHWLPLPYQIPLEVPLWVSWDRISLFLHLVQLLLFHYTDLYNYNTTTRRQSNLNTQFFSCFLHISYAFIKGCKGTIHSSHYFPIAVPWSFSCSLHHCSYEAQTCRCFAECQPDGPKKVIYEGMHRHSWIIKWRVWYIFKYEVLSSQMFLRMSVFSIIFSIQYNRIYMQYS